MPTPPTPAHHPPSADRFRSDLAAFQQTYKQLLNPATYREAARSAIQVLREGNAKDLVFAAVLTAEIIGFFKVGEIIGRRKLVGYRAQTHHHH
jgi:F-type H+-transporting ATPase subunit g